MGLGILSSYRFKNGIVFYELIFAEVFESELRKPNQLSRMRLFFKITTFNDLYVDAMLRIYF